MQPGPVIIASTPLAPPASASTAAGVSVVVPAYNASRFLPAALESILGQTLRDLDVIVVDDGSTDDTRFVAQSYAAHDPRVRVATGPNRGISHATNQGIRLARRRWVALMHADDVALPNRLAAQVDAAEAHPEVALWGTYAYHVNEAGERLSLSETGPPSVKEFLRRKREGALVGNVIASSAFFRAEDALAVGGFDAQFANGEDLEFFERMAQLGPVVSLSVPLMERRLHVHTNTMRTWEEMCRVTRFCEARREAWSRDEAPPTYDEYLAQYGRSPARARLADRVGDLSRYLYHEAGIDYGAGRTLSAMARFAQAAALNPGYAIPRVWRQLSGVRRETQRTEALGVE